MIDLGTDLIRAERERQIIEEGYEPEHDWEHSVSEFIDAAIAYLSPNDAGAWPWDRESFKPEAKRPLAPSLGPYPQHGTVRDLVKAGALIAAAIDRLQDDGSEYTS